MTEIYIDIERSVAPDGYEFVLNGEFSEIDVSNYDFGSETVWIGLSLKKKRWKPEENEIYYFINASFDVEKDLYWLSSDYYKQAAGNFFQTEKQAKEAAQRMKACLAEYQKELK